MMTLQGIITGSQDNREAQRSVHLLAVSRKCTSCFANAESGCEALASTGSQSTNAAGALQRVEDSQMGVDDCVCERAQGIHNQGSNGDVCRSGAWIKTLSMGVELPYSQNTCSATLAW